VPVCQSKCLGTEACKHASERCSAECGKIARGILWTVRDIERRASTIFHRAFLQDAALTETVQIAPGLVIPRIVNGMWQVSGSHGFINAESAVMAMKQYHNAGLTAWDMADIYGPAEIIFGSNKKLNPDSIGFTKFVPSPGTMSRSIVEYYVKESAFKMSVNSINLLQFHWWDYADKRYLDAIRHLSDLNIVSNLGLTNFDTIRLEEISDRVKIATNQIQYSILDDRPEQKMTRACQKRGILLLCYGVLLGGMCSERYLGKPEPDRAQLDTASLKKYKNMIDVWGGWELFQELLGAMSDIAKKHDASIANVAVRYVLDKPQVGAAIIGARLGVAEHIQDNLRVFGLKLQESDRMQIRSVQSESNNLFEIIGDCGDEYRR